MKQNDNSINELGNECIPEISLDEALQKTGSGFWQAQLVLILCAAVIAEASEATLLSFLGPCAQHEFSLTNSETSCINSVVFAGGVVGAMFFGPFADYKGRRCAYALCLGILFLFGLGTFFTRTYVELLLCRGFVGFGLGGGLAPFDFLVETVPPNIRGICCLLPSIFWGMGSVMTVGVAWLTLETFGWRTVALLCTTPVALALFTVFALPESPRWLLSQGRNEEALIAVQKAAKKNGVILEKFKLKAVSHSKSGAHARNILKQPLRKTTFLLFVNWASVGFCYYAVIQLYANFFETVSSGNNCSFSFKDILIPALSEPCMVIVMMFFIDKSRRITQSLNYLCAGIFCLLFGLQISPSSLVVIGFFARGCVNVSVAMTWIITPEFYPTEIRATAHAFFFNTARIGACLSSFVVYSALKVEQICGLIALLCFLSGISVMCMQETAGHLLDTVHIVPVPLLCELKRWKLHHYSFTFFRYRSSQVDQQDLMLHSNEPMPET